MQSLCTCAERFPLKAQQRGTPARAARGRGQGSEAAPSRAFPPVAGTEPPPASWPCDGPGSLAERARQGSPTVRAVHWRRRPAVWKDAARADLCSALLPWARPSSSSSAPAGTAARRNRSNWCSSSRSLACRGDAAMARLDVTETFAGLRLPGHLHTQDSLRAACAFPFRPSDVLLVTYPKSGTTWMQEILTLIYSRGDPEPAVSIPTWARAPWLEHIHFKELLQETQGPRLLTTHLPWRVLAGALRKGKPKVIYVARNPKDVAVSFYHFHKMANFFPDPGTLDDFLLRFLDGTVHYGSWFQHVKGWLSCQKEMSLFCLTYEELHQALESLAVVVQKEGALCFCKLKEGKEKPWQGYPLICSEASPQEEL
ncbi:3-beta-hydroxysteroid sulfotransferase-like isoform X2 [Paroedura picta]|uniref:3-beta-hydroxysteroid sulfotransferase-like isoform X2 n=1 Tax=Paroedura picta TaxID=143630 RepID=UPI0040565CCE